MTHGSLFTGIGGFDLAAEWNGIETRWQCEKDGYCRTVLRKRFPGVRRYSDIRYIDTSRLERVDIISGGFPCQPYSQAGKRRGAGDDRALWPEMLRVVQGVRPAWVIGENVAGFASMGLAGAVSDLEQAGYEVAVFDIPAVGVGAWHKRHRLWIFGHIANAQSDNARVMRIGDEETQPRSACGDKTIADPDRGRQQQSRGVLAEIRRWAHDNYQAFADSDGAGWEKLILTAVSGETGFDSRCVDRIRNIWAAEPDVGRVVNGIPARVDRIKCLGNAVVPQIPAILFACIACIARIEEPQKDTVGG